MTWLPDGIPVSHIYNVKPFQDFWICRSTLDLNKYTYINSSDMAPERKIKNALKRSEVHRKTKREKEQAKLKRRMDVSASTPRYIEHEHSLTRNMRMRRASELMV